jgi:Zn-dependent protease
MASMVACAPAVLWSRSGEASSRYQTEHSSATMWRRASRNFVVLTPASRMALRCFCTVGLVVGLAMIPLYGSGTGESLYALGVLSWSTSIESLPAGAPWVWYDPWRASLKRRDGFIGGSVGFVHMILGGLALVFFLQLLRWSLTFQNLLHIRLMRPNPQGLRPEAPSERWASAFSPIATTLRALGFEALGYDKVFSFAMAPGVPERLQYVAFHSGQGVLAKVMFAGILEPTNVYSVTFHACLADGTLLTGLNGEAWAVVGRSPGVEIVDPLATTVEAQWAEFQKTLRARARDPSPVSPASVLAATDRSVDLFLESLRFSGVVRPSDDGGGDRLTAASAARLAFQLMRGSRALRRLMRARANQAKTGQGTLPVIPPVAELERFRIQEVLRKTGSKRWPWLRVGFVSLVAFALSLFHWFDLSTLAVMIAVICFHELGHFLAMRAVGYQDTSIFFIPFFGAAAMGRKDEASLDDEILVLLAGPLPGIFLACALWVWAPDFSRSDFGSEVAWVLFGLNFLNLLPIFPLDGGRVVDALFLRQRPLWSVLFRAFASMLFFWGFFASGDVILALLGGLVLLSAPLGSRAARLQRALNKTPRAELGEEAAVEAILTAMQPLGLHTQPMAIRHTLIRQQLPKLARRVPSRIRQWGWGAAYSTCLLAALVAPFVMMLANVMPRSPQLPKRLPLDASSSVAATAPWASDAVPTSTVSVVAVLETATAADQLMPELLTRLEPNRVQRVGRTFFVALATPELAPTDALRRPDARRLIGTADAPLIFDFLCETASVRDADALKREWAIFETMFAAMYPLRPAWVGPLSPKEERARAVVIAVHDARLKVFGNVWNGFLRALLMQWTVSHDDLDSPEAAARDVKPRMAEEIRSELRNVDFDDSDWVLADTLIRDAQWGNSSTLAQSLGLLPYEVREFGARLPSDAAAPLGLNTLRIVKAGSRIWLRHVSFPRASTGAPAMLHALRDRCTSLTFSIEATETAVSEP